MPSVSLSSAIEAWQPTFLIIDAEGAERTIFEGADLSGVRKICIEIHPDVLTPAECTHVIRLILDAGFYLDVERSGDWVYFFCRENGRIETALLSAT